MRLIDRRLGVLFCAFLLIFSFALVRSFWLQGVKGGSLSAEARSQQVTRVTIPGERGRVLDRNGKVPGNLRGRRGRDRHPVPGREPRADRALRLHEVLGEPTTDLLNSLSDRSSGFAYLARKVDARRRRQGREAPHHRRHDGPRQQAASTRRATSPRR